MSSLRQALAMASFLLVAATGAIAAEDEVVSPPISITLDNNPFGAESTPVEDPALKFSFENYQPGPKTTPTPKVVKAPEPVNWLKVSMISGFGFAVAFVLWMYFRWLYYDNVFGPTYHFPIPPVTIRLGGAYGGGHGAVVRFKRQ